MPWPQGPMPWPRLGPGQLLGAFERRPLEDHQLGHAVGRLRERSQLFANALSGSRVGRTALGGGLAQLAEQAVDELEFLIVHVATPSDSLSALAVGKSSARPVAAPAPRITTKATWA